MHEASVKDVYKCPSCKHVFVDYQDDGLSYHRNEYRTNKHGNRTTGEVIDGKFTDKFHSVRHHIMKSRCNIIKNIVDDCDSMLDIGAGGGSFVNMVRDRFKHLQIDCQEISNLCVNNLIEYGYENVYHGDINDIDFNKSYDLVTCWHVLEHIKDLHAFVDTVDKITNRYLILEVPIKRRLRYPNDGGWDGHYHYFSEESMRMLFSDKFKHINIETPGIQKPSMTVILQK